MQEQVDVRLTSIGDSSLDDRLASISEQLAQLNVYLSSMVIDHKTLAAALDRISRGGAVGHHALRFE